MKSSKIYVKIRIIQKVSFSATVGELKTVGLEDKYGHAHSDKHKFFSTTMEQEILQGLRTELQKKYVMLIKITSN
jgi:hypothetical protein